MRFSVSFVLAILATSALPSFAIPLELQERGGSKDDKSSKGSGWAGALGSLLTAGGGLATSIINMKTQQQALQQQQATNQALAQSLTSVHAKRTLAAGNSLGGPAISPEQYQKLMDYIHAQNVAHQVREWLGLEARGYDYDADLYARDRSDEESGAFSLPKFSLPKFSLPKVTLPDPKTLSQYAGTLQSLTGVGTQITNTVLQSQQMKQQAESERLQAQASSLLAAQQAKPTQTQ